ncbi:MAG: Hsp70 family protein [Janthinobacterium lividum]
MTFCAIDFGTSNSAVALPAGDAMQLVPLEGGSGMLPSAIFFNTEDHTRLFGRQAIERYVEGYDGRLMRSLKSILGSPLALATTEIGDGTALPFLDVIGIFLAHLIQTAERHGGARLTRGVLGRPVFFVDGDDEADQAAEAQLAAAAHAAGLEEVHFQYEPIAAAFDYESRLSDERLVMVADIGGGTSDFSLIRLGPQRARRLERRDDVLAHGGVHLAGTDFDKRVALASTMRELGYGSLDVAGREVPNRLYFDLATWHLINTVYTARRIAEFDAMRHDYREPIYHARSMRVLEQCLGHALAASAEAAKIAVSNGGSTSVDMSFVEAALRRDFDEAALIEAGALETRRIVDAALTTCEMAGVRPDRVDAVYFTGGSTGLRFLSSAIARAFPQAEPVQGDRLSSVAAGLGIHARRVFR